MAKWIKTTFPGVRYREHESRKHGVKYDQYFTIRYKLNGKDKEEGLGWASEGWTARKALERLSAIKQNIKSGEGPQTLAEKRDIERKRKEAEKVEHEKAEKENVTFGRFMTELYLPQSARDKKAKSYTIEEMLYRRHLAGTLADLALANIKPFHLERIKKDMNDKNLSDRTIEYALQVIRHAFNVARKLGIYTGESPTKAVKWPRVDNVKLRYLSLSETKMLLTALAAKSKNLHDIALLSLHAGLRFGELARLTWSCVNWEAGTLAILNAKTGSRTAYLTDQAKAMLKSRKQGRPDDLIFPKQHNTSGEANQASKTFTGTVTELKLNEGVTDRKQRVTFHTLRHTYATHLYENTHDLYLTQRSLGHATGTMTARYAKMSENRLRDAAAVLGLAFSKQTEQEAEQAEQKAS